MKTATLKMLVYSTVAAASVAVCYLIVFYGLGPLSGYSFSVRFFTPFAV